MKTIFVSRPILSSACILALAACAPQESPVAKAAAEATVKAAADASQQAAATAALEAPTKAGEFTLTITPDSAVASANAIPVHVLSLTADQVMQYKTMGADNYWKAPSSQAQSRVFGSSGSKGATTLKVPSKPGANTVVIIAKLPPSSGGDARILEVPLKRQPGADPLKPTSPPVSVRLTSLGLLPN